MLPLAELFPVFTERFAEIPEVQQGIVRIAWNHCVGANLRQVSDPVDFHSGTLVVKVTHSQWQATLTPMRPEIISKINRYLKRPLLQEIRIEIK